jgi:anti-sigma B factor antagonist
VNSATSPPAQGQVHHKKGRLRITGEMTVYSAASLKQELFAALGRHRRATLMDLSEVREFDTAGLQLLLAARSHAASLGRKLAVVDPSGVVSEVLDLCHLNPSTADSVQ